MPSLLDAKTTELPVEKSELLFLYESTYSIPNGDPFTGEQRYDEETKHILVSDVRIKRFIRDYLFDNGQDIYVRNDRSSVQAGDAESGAAARFNTIEAEVKGTATKTPDALQVLTKMIDVRLFGGISTKKGNAVNLTGPVQFALLNPSLNKVDLRMHQNTSLFSSSVEKSRGAIGTTTVVPYALCQIHGWINPFAARHSNLTQSDITAMLAALWQGINAANTRTKSNQNSLLLLQVVYADARRKLYGLDRTLKMTLGERDGTTLRSEQVRSSDDYSLDFQDLVSAIDLAGDAVKAVRYYTDSDAVRGQLQGQKFTPLSL